METYRETIIDYISQHRYYYRIAYRKVGLFEYEWDILVRRSEDEHDFLGLTFGWEKTLFPKKAMTDILIGYAEWKDEENLKLGVNLDLYRALN